MSIKVMISQPRYLPSISYLKRIASVDKFIVLDTVQRVKRGFENRNRLIDNRKKPQWLTLPVKSSSRELIKDSVLDGLKWKKDHRHKVECWYGDNPELVRFFNLYTREFKTDSYNDGLIQSLKWILNHMNITTTVVKASSLNVPIRTGIDYLIDLTKEIGGDTYVSGSTCLKYGLTYEYANQNGIDLLIDEISGVEYGWVDWIYKNNKFNKTDA